MLPRRLPCPPAALLPCVTAATTSAATARRLYILRGIRHYVSSASLAATVLDPHNIVDDHGCHGAIQPPRRHLQVHSSLKFTDMEQTIWDCIRRNDMKKIIDLSRRAFNEWQANDTAISPLTQFMLVKRLSSVDGILAGIYAAMQTGTLSGLEDYSMLFAALLADQDAGLIDMYNNLSSQQRASMNNMFSACAVYTYNSVRQPKLAKLAGKSITKPVYLAVRRAMGSPAVARARIPAEIVACVEAAASLRGTKVASVRFDLADRVVRMLLGRGIALDLAPMKSLIKSALRLGQPGFAISVYASKKHPQGAMRDAVVNLAIRRSEVARQHPNLHCDVMCALVRGGNLEGALTVAGALKCRRTFHLLLANWGTKHSGDWQAVERIVDMMLADINKPILHATHHAAISQILDAIAPQTPPEDVKAILRCALLMHFKLAPRLESPSASAIHMLMRALSSHDLIYQAFMVFRDAESRSAWVAKGKFKATESIYAVLADSLARTDDIRAITFLSRTAVRSGVTASVHYYTAIICGLTRKPQPAQLGEFFLRKTQVADSLLADMKRYSIKRPAKVYHSLMYAWAVLKHPKQVRAYFDELCGMQSGELSCNSVVSEVTWGILMYAYVRAGNVTGVMDVLREATKWLLANHSDVRSPSDIPASIERARTSYLLNMAMTSLLAAKDPHAALSLLDENISQPTVLSASPGDPVTLNLIMRALLSDNQLPKAMDVYDQIRAQYELPESPSDLTMVLRHCIQTSDVNGAFALVGRLMQAGVSLTDHQWHAFMRLCVWKCSPDTVLYIYEQMCIMAGIDGIQEIPKLLVRFPEVADWVCTAMEDTKRTADARAVRRSLTSAEPSPLPLAIPSSVRSDRPKCLSLYRGILRQVRVFPVQEMRAKLKHNARFTFELYRDLPTGDPQIARLIDEGRSQIKWLQGWHTDGSHKLLLREESK